VAIGDFRQLTITGDWLACIPSVALRRRALFTMPATLGKPSRGRALRWRRYPRSRLYENTPGTEPRNALQSMPPQRKEGDVAAAADRMRSMRVRRRGRGLREARLIVPDAPSSDVRFRIGAAVAALNSAAEQDALA
jgi:hypothetical protein